MRASTLCVCICVAVPSVAASQPAMRGYTGLIEAPTADVVAGGDVNIGLSVREVEHFTEPHYFANYGIADRAEIGVTFLDRPNRWGKPVANAKFQLVKATDRHPAVAIGIADATDRFGAAPYVVASWLTDWTPEAFGHELGPIRLHAGMGGGRFDGEFAGVEVPLGPKLELIVERSVNIWNGGLRSRVDPHLTVQGSMLDLQDISITACYAHSLD